MKHIIPFNEAITGEFLSELKDFCEMNLAYLIDDGLRVGVSKHPISTDNIAYVTIYSSSMTCGIRWNDLTDSMIPFFTRLRRDYNVVSFDKLPVPYRPELSSNEVRFSLDKERSNHKFKSYTLDQVINDEIDFDGDIFSIAFYVSDVTGYDANPVVKKSIGSRIKKFLGFDDSHLRVV
jgi:hypothetical protein